MLVRCFRSAILGFLALLTGATTGATDSTDVETALALSAAPHELRPQAGVWIRTPSGYRQTRRGTNGLQCLVDQETAATLEPQCRS
jgi:hypothetical protein